MKCPVCGYAMLATDPECLRCAHFAGRGISLPRVRTERLITSLLTLVLVLSLLALFVLAGHRPEVTTESVPQTQASQQASSDSQGQSSLGTDDQAARRDAQGDQSADD